MPKTHFDQLNQQGVAVLDYYAAGNISAGALKHKWVAPVAGTIVGVRAHLGTAPAGSTAILDINKNGTTLYTTQGARPTFADGGDGAATTTLPAVTAVAAGDVLTLDVDAVGSGTAGAALAVAIAIKTALVAD